jgi:hypothetical protein
MVTLIVVCYAKAHLFSVVTELEVFHAHMLNVYFYFCRLTFLVHTLRQMRMHIPPGVAERAGTMFFSSSKVNTHTGCGFALTCARDALATSEALLTTILSIKDRNLLATAPDSVFAMISFAAAHLTMSRFLILQSKAMRDFPGVSRELLGRTVKCLRQVSLSTDDNSSRCARVISGFLDMWNDKQESHGPDATGETCDLNDSPQAVSALLSSGSNPTPEYASSESTMAGPPHESTSSIGGYDYMFNLDQDPLFGLDFCYLMGNPNMQPDINESCKLLLFDCNVKNLAEINLNRHRMIKRDGMNVWFLTDDGVWLLDLLCFRLHIQYN